MLNEDFSYENYCEKYINAIHSPIFAENTSSLSLKPIITYENVIWENRLNRLLRRNIIKPNVLIEGNKDGNFFSLTYKDEADNNINKDFHLGWKFHIAIDDSPDNDLIDNANSPNENNLRRGWNIVKDILIEHKVYNTKVATPNCHFSTNHHEKQYGKQITVYASQDQRANDCAFWQSLLQEIETRLYLANIRPDQNRLLCQDLQISGTGRYCSYRNDVKNTELLLSFG